MPLRRLGTTDIQIAPIALGCWPIAGMTSLDVNDVDSLATLEACFDLGINHLDTAYAYGAKGESEQLIRRALKHRRDQVVIATKGGIHWRDNGERVQDASPMRLRRECEESLRRLGTEQVELYYVHAPDPSVPLCESAGEVKRLMDEGKVRAAGLSNGDRSQLEEFASACPLSACQPPYNMLQRDIEQDLVPWCREQGVSILVYWPLMKGLLAGGLTRDHRFAPGDGRAKYPMYQGDEWVKNMDFVDRLREIAAEAGHTVAQLVLQWTITQPGISAALCGAKRPEQIRENAGGMGWELTEGQRSAIDQALAERGTPVTRGAVT